MRLGSVSRLLLPLLLAAAAAPAGAQTIKLVKDINLQPLSNPSSSPYSYQYTPYEYDTYHFARLGSYRYFRATTAALGSELWRTDGTAAGTTLVADIYPGTGSSSPYGFAEMGGFLYFYATDGVNGTELWRTDGTATGTTMVADIYPGSGSSTPNNMTAAGSLLFFSAFDGTATTGTGRELYVTDGTKTTLLADIYPGTSSSSPSYLTPLGTKLLFVASSGTTAPATGTELYISDGTPAGTALLMDIYPGTSSSSPNYLAEMGGKVYFGATTSTQGKELWVTDGTPAGTTLLLDIYASGSSSSPSYLTPATVAAGPRIFFRATSSGIGSELWMTDGTAGGTVLVKDLYTGSSSSSPYRFTPAPGGLVYFIGAASGTGTELWVTDGTAAGTAMLADIYAGSSSSSPNYICPLGKKVLFQAAAGTGTGLPGTELWESDGTPKGTQLLLDIYPGTSSGSPAYLTPVGSKVLFAANDGMAGTELWESDGTPGGTKLLVDINTPDPSATGSSSPAYLTDLAGITYFSASDGVNGTELWRTDGTAAGTMMVADINPGPNSSSPANLTRIGAAIYFTASDGVNGTELWRTDGTAPGTMMVADIYAGASSASPSYLTPKGALLFFSASSGTTAPGTGTELWVTDGTPGGTKLVLDINPGTASSSPAYLCVAGDTLFFRANTAADGYELWKSDGTAAGTTIVTNLQAGTTSGYANYIFAVNWVPAPYVLFAGNDGNGYELWRSDGTAAGTTLVKEIYPGTSASSPNYFTRLGGRILFTATDGVNGIELWATDGTPAGTAMVADLYPGASSSSPLYFTPLGGRLLFSALDGTATTGLGRELYATDGTPAGTALLVDINPGTGSSSPNYLTPVGDRKIYFAATDGTTGTELWATDGTAAGTALVEDLNPGSLSGSPYALCLSAGRLLFRDTAGTRGAELCCLFPGATAHNAGGGYSVTLPAAPYHIEPRLTATDPLLGQPMKVSIRPWWSYMGSGVYHLLVVGLVEPKPWLLGEATLFVQFPLALVVVGNTAPGLDVALPIPNDPALQGIPFAMQGFIAPTPTGPWMVDVTNALYVTPGAF